MTKKKAITLQIQLTKLLLLLNNDPAVLRKEVFKHPKLGLLLFALYYYTENLTYPFSSTHIEYIMSLQSLFSDEPDHLHALLVIGARNSGKTALATIALTYAIPYNLQKYVTITTADPQNSSGYLYSIRNTLLSNNLLIRDFSHLIPRQRIDKETGIVNRQKAEDFIAANPKRTRFEALSTQQSLRGRLYDSSRITALIMDDIETMASVRSEVITEQIANQIKESENATADDHRILLLGNKLTNFGNVSALETKYLNQQNTKIIRLSLLDEQDNIVWDTKFVQTREEATQLNERYNLNLQSIQRIREANDSITFAAEHLARPLDNLLAVFKPEMFRYYPEEELLRTENHPTHIVIAIDTAVTAKSTSDFTGFTIRYSNSATPHKHYVHTQQLKLLPQELFHHIKQTYLTLRAQYPIANILFGWEKMMATQSLHQFWNEYARTHNLPITMYLLDHHGKKKEDRITDFLLHRYETGQIYHLTNNRFNLNQKLEQQLILFPTLNKNDDLADSLSMSFSREFLVLTTLSQYTEMIPTTQKRINKSFSNNITKKKGLLF